MGRSDSISHLIPIGAEVLTKVYKFDGGTSETVYAYLPCSISPIFLLKIVSRTAYASFGGLLMSLTGSFRHMTSIVLGDPVYLLMRK